MKTVLQKIVDDESEVVVYLDGEEEKICIWIYIKPRLVHVPTPEAERYQHTYVPFELLYEAEEFPGVMFTINVKALPDAIYIIPVEHDHDFEVF